MTKPITQLELSSDHSPIDKTLSTKGDYILSRSYHVPVNMDPSKKRRRPTLSSIAASNTASGTDRVGQPNFGEDTDHDREKALAEAELTNLWDATEVIDMDKV